MSDSHEPVEPVGSATPATQPEVTDTAAFPVFAPQLELSEADHARLAIIGEPTQLMPIVVSKEQ